MKKHSDWLIIVLCYGIKPFRVLFFKKFGGQEIIIIIRIPDYVPLNVVKKLNM